MILNIFATAPQPQSHPLPLADTRVAAGFPSPALDCMEGALDLNEHLVKRPAATFIVGIEGESMTGAGIHNGDLAVVDRSLAPRHDDIVIAIIDGAFTITRLFKKNGRVMLCPENDKYTPILIDNDTALDI